MDHKTIALMIARIAAESDPDRQHALEYYLYKHFIRHVAATAPEPYRSQALQILTTDTFEIGKVHVERLSFSHRP